MLARARLSRRLDRRRPASASLPALPPERYAVDGLADRFWAVADTLGLERPVLAGHSWGGTIASTPLRIARRPCRRSSCSTAGISTTPTCRGSNPEATLEDRIEQARTQVAEIPSFDALVEELALGDRAAGDVGAGRGAPRRRPRAAGRERRADRDTRGAGGRDARRRRRASEPRAGRCSPTRPCRCCCCSRPSRRRPGRRTRRRRGSSGAALPHAEVRCVRGLGPRPARGRRPGGRDDRRRLARPGRLADRTYNPRHADDRRAARGLPRLLRGERPPAAPVAPRSSRAPTTARRCSRARGCSRRCRTSSASSRRPRR